MERKLSHIPFLIFIIVLSAIFSGSTTVKAFAYSQDSAPITKLSPSQGQNSLQSLQNIGSTDDLIQYSPDDYPIHSGFPIYLNDWVERAPTTIADINADGSNEILLPTWNGRIYAWNASGSLLAGYPIITSGHILGRLALGDLDHDSKLEIAAGVGSSSNGVNVKLYIWRSDGSLYPGWPQDTACDLQSFTCIMTAIALADLDGDSNLEIIAATNNGTGDFPDPYQSFPALYAWRSNGQLFSGNWPISDEYDVCIGGTMAVGDLSGDGKADIVIGFDYNRLFAFDNEGNNLPDWPIYSFWPYDENDWNDDQIEFARSAVTLADLDGDGTLEYIVNGLRRYAENAIYYNTDLLVYTPEGVRWNNWETPASGSGLLSQNTWRMMEAPAVADINGDYRPDIVVSTQDGWVRAYTAEKQLLWAFDYAQGNIIYATETIIGDVNGDGWNEVLFGTFDVDFGNSGPFGVFILDHNGLPLPGAEPLVVNDNLGVTGAPTLADLDGDGNIEIAASTYNGYVYVWDVPGQALPGRLSWPMARHDLQRTGYYVDPSPNFIQSYKIPSDFTPQPYETVAFTTTLIQSGVPNNETIRLTNNIPSDLSYIPGSLRASSGIVDESQAPLISWSGIMLDISEVIISYSTKVSGVSGPITNTTLVDAGSAGEFELAATLIVNGKQYYLPVLMR